MVVHDRVHRTGGTKMDPITKVLRSIYYGDRACLGLVVDGTKSEIRLQIDVISRIRSETGEWEFYNDENIDRGFVVFDDVRWFSLGPSSVGIPNDYLNSIEVTGVDGPDVTVSISVGSVAEWRPSMEVLIEIVCRGAHLETEDGTIVP
jgi:uncharacterized protein DUF6258